jgi:pyruvate/2-oxoglutarate dehydrogenase complex dihydrolipoamide dehydrogenase (E3) component
MRVERGRGALAALAEPEAGAGGEAAQAFERLGAEVTILCRAMESLAAAVVSVTQKPERSLSAL